MVQSINVMILATALFLTSACSKPITNAPTPNNGETATQPEDPADATKADPNLFYAWGWNEITIYGNQAKTTVSVAAHIKTNRNACGKEAYGVLDFDDWNVLARNLNMALAEPFAEQEHCILAPTDTNRYLWGLIIEAKLPSGESKTLFEMKDDEVICTHIANAEYSDGLFKQLDKVILLADKEDCPFGWGSALSE